MRILLTGGSGFIGSNLVPSLCSHDVLALDLENKFKNYENVSFVHADLSKPETWKDEVIYFNPDACLHLAWKGLPDYSLKNSLTNLVISAQLLDICKIAQCKKIFISGTCWEYGNLNGPVSETDMPKETGLFGSVKSSIRIIGDSICKETDINLIWGRIFFVYGPGQRPTSLIPSCFNSIKNKFVPEIKSPYAINDFIHIKDVVNGIKTLIETDNLSGIYNIGSGIPLRVADIVSIISEICEFDGSLLPFDNNQKGNGFWANISSIKKDTLWEPTIPIKDGIKMCVKEWNKEID